MRITSRSGARKVQPVTSATAINASARRASAPRVSVKGNPIMASLSPEQKLMVRALEENIKNSQPITAATNTSNIAARPDFLEMLPLFVQKLIITDVFGSVPMNSRSQLVPYYKFISETTKGETNRGTVLSTPFSNRQGKDPNFTGRTVKNEIVAETSVASSEALIYTPVLPGSVTLQAVSAGTTNVYTDDNSGQLVDATGTKVGTIDYANGKVNLDTTTGLTGLKATYQYDNETVGPDETGRYGAKMGKGYLELDEIILKAEAHQLACYASIYSMFAAQQEYGTNISDMAKEAAFSEITAEINTTGFELLRSAASYKPQYDFDASPVMGGAVDPTGYLNTFKLKLTQAANAVYQVTELARPNKLIVGTNAAAFISMLDQFTADTTSDTVGPYHYGTFDNFDVYVAPTYHPDQWVMCAKSDSDIRRSSALFGEYMPLTETGAIQTADATVQNGFVSMYAQEIVNPDTIVSGRILGSF